MFNSNKILNFNNFLAQNASFLLKYFNGADLVEVHIGAAFAKMGEKY